LLFDADQAPYILSQPLHHSQQMISNDEHGLHVQLKVYITRELIMSILSYGGDVEVLTPQQLIKEIERQVVVMGKLYKIQLERK
jgi:predicted DNA-binding transcriptional regulator YafY